MRGAILAPAQKGCRCYLNCCNRPISEITRWAFRWLENYRPKESQRHFAEIERTSPQRQANLLLALADRRDASCLPAVLEIAQDGSTAARTAALDVVRRLGDVSTVAALLQIAAEDDAEVAQAAKATLENLPGQEVNDALVARLDQAQGNVQRHVLLELVGLRRIPAVPALLKAADDPDDQVRSAALAALGETVELKESRDAAPASGEAEQRKGHSSCLAGSSRPASACRTEKRAAGKAGDSDESRTSKCATHDSRDA